MRNHYRGKSLSQVSLALRFFNHLVGKSITSRKRYSVYVSLYCTRTGLFTSISFFFLSGVFFVTSARKTGREEYLYDTEKSAWKQDGLMNENDDKE